ncbi:hypothetical protein J3T91_02285 [Bifidobacterium sp. B4001]|uniref:hypothetical protein n=1 Tax=Bifidobacterium sp. B4001 TaxID=2817961 RepID=UPI00226B23DC|nr:hypothetical protein [Bifidobacterium sp. B4001]MCX8672347.1 hypothetical protein [Bifidobacterium sp. B4079]MCX8680781.1 hypothetical protein [Bifidobacterium sp. B4001]
MNMPLFQKNPGRIRVTQGVSSPLALILMELKDGDKDDRHTGSSDVRGHMTPTRRIYIAERRGSDLEGQRLSSKGKMQL